MHLEPRRYAKDGWMPDAVGKQGDSTETRLVEGRTCGTCDVCCIMLTIEDPELRKVQGYRCPHLKPRQGCSIYATRPHTCRTFYCGWRQLKWVRESLRPDRSGVLVKLDGEVEPDGTRRLGVSITLLNRAALQAEGLAETVAAAVDARVPVFLTIPGPPGYTSARAKMNAHLEPAVAAKNKAEVLRILAQAQRQGRRGENRRIVLAAKGAGVPGGVAPEDR
jgi:hypothetical protein